MSIVEGFERKALFNITRLVALLCVTVFLLAIIVGALYGFSVWKEQVTTKVSVQEIIDQIKPVEPTVTGGQPRQGAQASSSHNPELSPLFGYRVPFALQKYVSGENAQILRNHLDAVAAADRQEYLNELGAVVTEVESKGLNAVDAINAYMNTKSARYAEAAAKRVQKWETLKLVSAGVAACLMLVALFSLVLVLLAIERNTRPRQGNVNRNPMVQSDKA